MGGLRKHNNRLTALTESARYLWAHRYGRLFVLMVLVGVIGLATHYWAPVLLVGAIRTERAARHS